MGFEVQVYRRAMPEGMLGVDGELCLGKYECHMNGRAFAAGMESISEVVDEISGTFGRKCESDEVIISSPPRPQDTKLRTLLPYERREFMQRAPLLSYVPGFVSGFLPN